MDVKTKLKAFPGATPHRLTKTGPDAASVAHGHSHLRSTHTLLLPYVHHTSSSYTQSNMGNDGGSIPDRRDLVRNKPKAEQADKANQTRARWFYCALSKRKLQEPIVSCALGKVYNKDAILEFLLDRSTFGDGDTICGHIRSLKVRDSWDDSGAYTHPLPPCAGRQAAEVDSQPRYPVTRR